MIDKLDDLELKMIMTVIRLKAEEAYNIVSKIHEAGDKDTFVKAYMLGAVPMSIMLNELTNRFKLKPQEVQELLELGFNPLGNAEPEQPKTKILTPKDIGMSIEEIFRKFGSN